MWKALPYNEKRQKESSTFKIVKLNAIVNLNRKIKS